MRIGIDRAQGAGDRGAVLPFGELLGGERGLTAAQRPRSRAAIAAIATVTGAVASTTTTGRQHQDHPQAGAVTSEFHEMSAFGERESVEWGKNVSVRVAQVGR